MTVRTNMPENPLFVMSDGNREYMRWKNRMWLRESLWIKKIERMKYWFKYRKGDGIYETDITSWCGGVGIPSKNYLIDVITREYPTNISTPELLENPEPEYRDGLLPYQGTIGFALSQDAHVFLWAWCDGEDTYAIESPVADILRFYKWWRKWRPDSHFSIGYDSHDFG